MEGVWWLQRMTLKAVKLQSLIYNINKPKKQQKKKQNKKTTTKKKQDAT